MSEYEMLLLFKRILDSTAQNRLQNVKLLLSDDTLKVTWTVEGKEEGEL